MIVMMSAVRTTKDSIYLYVMGWWPKFQDPYLKTWKHKTKVQPKFMEQDRDTVSRSFAVCCVASAMLSLRYLSCVTLRSCGNNLLCVDFVCFMLVI